MPALGQFLGALLAEIANARMQADLESVRIAHLYASHPLLKGMAVPRFRTPTIVLDLPLAVESVALPQENQPRPAADLAAARKEVDIIVAEELKKGQIPAGGATAAGLKEKLDTIFKELKKSGTSASAPALAAERVVQAVFELLESAGNTSESAGRNVESSLRQKLGLEFSKLQPPSPPVQVVAVTSALKELGPVQNLMRLHLTITEEGVEWTQLSPSDPDSKTLLPE